MKFVVEVIPNDDTWSHDEWALDIRELIMDQLDVDGCSVKPTEEQ